MFANYIKTDNRVNDRAAQPSRQIRIGDRVQNGRHGRGVVQGFGPDGALVVRFDKQKKSRSVFPTFLERAGR